MSLDTINDSNAGQAGKVMTELFGLIWSKSSL